MTTETDKTWVNSLWERKAPQYVGTYLTVGFALLQFLVFITNRYELNGNWIDKYLFVWLAILPAIFTLSYFGGQLYSSTNQYLKWPKYLVFGNIFIALILGFFLFNKEVNASEKNELIELTNEEGEKVKAFVPSLNKVKSVACFQFDNLTKDKEQDWWGVAFSQLLQLNLEQRPEFYVFSEYHLFGYYDALGLKSFSVPSVGMQREIAQKTRNDYFTRVSYTFEGKQFTFNGNLYRTSDGKSIIELQAIDQDPFVAIDNIKQQIVEQIPNALEDLENLINLPVSTLVTNNIEALEKLTQAQVNFAKNPSEVEKTINLSQKAIALDQTCAFCHSYLGYVYNGMGNLDDAIVTIKKAIKFGASLPERMQFSPKGMLYLLTNKMEAYAQLQEMHRKMYPYDFHPYQSLIPLYKANYGIDSAKILVHEAIDNGNIERGLLALFQIQLDQEEYEEAEQTLDRFSKELPNRKQDKLKYVTLYGRQGKLEKVREILLKEETLDPLNPDIQVQLAYLDFKNLNISEAISRVEEGFTQSTTLTDSLDFLWAKGYFYRRTGQIDKFIKLVADYEKYALQQRPVANVIGTTFNTKYNAYLAIGQVPKIQELIAERNQYYPETTAIMTCEVNTHALRLDFKMLMSSEEYAACHKDYQSYGEGYGEYFQLMMAYLAKDYSKCLEILEADGERIGKLFTDKYFLAKVYGKAGKLDKAKEIAQVAIDKKTDNPTDYYLMATFLEKEDKVAAKKYLDVALQYWSNADEDFIPLQRAKALETKLQN